MSVYAPKITCQDVMTRLNGTYTGSSDTFWFWEQSISSGSLLDIVSGSSSYLRGLLGNTVMDDTETVKARRIKELELLYTCFRTLVLLSGGVIVEGFTWDAGVRVSSPAMLPAYQNLIESFRVAAWDIFKTLQTFVLSEDADQPYYHKTSQSVM